MATDLNHEEREQMDSQLYHALQNFWEYSVLS